VADTAKPAPIDTAAICAAISDSDKDNVADAQDKCPNTPAGAIVDSTGCPVDSDKDGVADGLDKCPNNPEGALVDYTGCPVDSDKDGVQDYKDKCPNTPENTKVDSVGCTLDSDKDGIIDAIDQCPNTLPGVEVNEVGCPIHKKEDLSQLRKGIQFKLNSAELTKKSFGTLNDIADLMNKHEQAKLEIQGHTDSNGTQEYNQNLSERRAQAVADYLIKKGIATDRVRAIGYGSTRPIADNKTKAGREANRRVELVPFN
jgi:outer membrane protein OmpA-like peptidoglycan-associated protein